MSEAPTKTGPVILDLDDYGSDTETITVDVETPKGTIPVEVEYEPGALTDDLVQSFRKVQLAEIRRRKSGGKRNSGDLELLALQSSWAIDVLEAMGKSWNVYKSGRMVAFTRDELAKVRSEVLIQVAAQLVSPGEE